jgi:hypothetical protein
VLYYDEADWQLLVWRAKGLGTQLPWKWQEVFDEAWEGAGAD